jgi:16S rRNA C1402 N4-methylase RsmH
LAKDIGEGNFLKVITKKPILPSVNEVLANPKSRSSKLRAYEKIL